MTQKLISVLLVAVGLIVFSGCSQPVAEQQQEEAVLQATLKTISHEEFAALVQQQAVQLIDVRTPAEFAEGHLRAAQNIDYYRSDFTTVLEGLQKEQPVLVYCAVGGRSAEAAQILKRMGFLQVYELQGGIKAWKKGGREVVQD